MQELTKSPIKEKPLRHAGQSLDQKIDDLVNEKFAPHLYGAVILTVIAAYQWLIFSMQRPPQPMFMSVIAATYVAYASYKFVRTKALVRNIRLGRDGERIVGECLDNLREDGHRIFHDIVGSNFNLDHVIMSTKGIFVIETKTYSKPAKGDVRISFDGKQIIIGDRGSTSEPIVQATSAAKWLKNILKESTGRDYNVKPVIVFPGWYVNPMPDGGKSSVWVLNPSALQSFIKNEDDKITHDDMMLATFHLARYIRSKAA